MSMRIYNGCREMKNLRMLVWKRYERTSQGFRRRADIFIRFKAKITWNIQVQFVPRSKHCPSMSQKPITFIIYIPLLYTNQSILYKKIYFFTQIHSKHTTRSTGRIKKLLNVKPDGHNRVPPKVMPLIYFHGNYNIYKEYNNTIW